MPVTTRRRSSLQEAEMLEANTRNTTKANVESMDIDEISIEDQSGVDERKMSTDTFDADLEKEVLEALHRSEEENVEDTAYESDEESSDADSKSQTSIRIDITNDDDADVGKKGASNEADANQASPIKSQPTRSPPTQFVSAAPAITTATTTNYDLYGGLSSGYRYQIEYTCGSKMNSCDARFVLTDRDAMSCRECGGRIIMKLRTKRLVQFEAR